MELEKREITLEEAQSVVMGSVRTLETELVPLSRALGRMLRAEITADIDYPTADISAVDGYCFAASVSSPATKSNPALLTVVGTVRAGEMPGLKLNKGECAAIMTGAALPEGADAVARLEDVELRGNAHIAVFESLPVGKDVRKAGEIAKKGERVLEAGKSITPLILGLLASLCGGEVEVARSPKVGLLATGDELVPHGTYPPRGCIRSSNSQTLGALLAELGCEVVDAGISGDTEGDIVDHIETCAHCDAVVITGGISAGEYDLVRHCLRKIGAEIVFGQVCMTPGKMTVFARKDHRVFFCLPGNPTSSLVSFHMIVRPGLLAMMGGSYESPAPVKARVTSGLNKTPGLRTFVPSRLLPDLRVQPVRFRGSGDVRSLGQVDCLISLDDDTSRVRQGQWVDVFPLVSVTL